MNRANGRYDDGMPNAASVATCVICEEPMGGSSCLVSHYIFDDGSEIARLPYSRWLKGNPDKYDDDVDEQCGDCGVSLGGLHHRFCDMEQCALCWDQAIGCGCL